MQVRVQKWGNSLAVRIPKPLAEDAKVEEGTVLNLAVSEGKVIATRRNIEINDLDGHGGVSTRTPNRRKLLPNSRGRGSSERRSRATIDQELQLGW